MNGRTTLVEAYGAIIEALENANDAAIDMALLMEDVKNGAAEQPVRTHGEIWSEAQSLKAVLIALSGKIEELLAHEVRLHFSEVPLKEWQGLAEDGQR